MKLRLTREQLANITWLEFHAKKTDSMVSMAVDPTSEERTGKLRFVNGALVPMDAVPEDGAPRDPFCTKVLDLVAQDLDAREERERDRAAKAKPPADGVRIRGEVAEVWKAGVLLGTFPAERLGEVPERMNKKARTPRLQTA